MEGYFVCAAVRACFNGVNISENLIKGSTWCKKVSRGKSLVCVKKVDVPIIFLAIIRPMISLDC